MNDDAITTEFKNAARSVAALYKLSTLNSAAMKSQGYLECLEDLLMVIKSNEDVQEWALRKKLQLECATGLPASHDTDVRGQHDTAKGSESTPAATSSSLVIPDDYSFTMESSPGCHKFPPSNPILSVERRNSRVKKDHRRLKQVDSDLSSVDETAALKDTELGYEQRDEDSLKRKAFIESYGNKKTKH